MLYFSTYTEYVTNRFTHVSRPIMVSAINDKCAQGGAKRGLQVYQEVANIDHGTN